MTTPKVEDVAGSQAVAEESVDDKISKFVAQKFGTGSAEETAPTPDDEPVAEAEPDEDADDLEAGAAADDGDADDKGAKDGEGDDDEDDDAQPWTDEQVAQFMEANPRWPDTLDKEGWGRVPAPLRAILKSGQREMTRREQAVAERERAMAAKKAEPPKEKREEKKGLSSEEIYHMLNDPDRAGEVIELIAEMVADRKIGERVPVEEIEAMREQGRILTALDNALGELVDEGISEAATFGEPEKEAMLEVLGQRPELARLVESGDPDKLQIAFEKAARAVIRGKSEKVSEKQRRQLEEARRIKEERKQKKARDNANLPPSHAVDTRGGQPVKPDDDSIPIDDRIRSVFRKKTSAAAVR